MVLKTKEEIELMCLSARLVSKTLGMLAEKIQPGVTTLALDHAAEEFIRDHGGVPGFLGLYNFPNTLCVSPNEQVVHGIPNTRPIREGDILSVDCGVFMNGFHGDHAYTFPVGEISQEASELLEVTERSLYKGIEAFVIGGRTEDIGYAIQTYTEAFGYGVVRELVGHGLGRDLHEKPEVPNYGKKGRGKKIVEGMTLAIEPMINMGTHRVRTFKDGSVITADKKYSAHFEHNIAILDGRTEILSTFDNLYKALNKENVMEKECLLALSKQT